MKRKDEWETNVGNNIYPKRENNDGFIREGKTYSSRDERPRVQPRSRNDYYDNAQRPERRSYNPNFNEEGKRFPPRNDNRGEYRRPNDNRVGEHRNQSDNRGYNNNSAGNDTRQRRPRISKPESNPNERLVSYDPQRQRDTQYSNDRSNTYSPPSYNGQRRDNNHFDNNRFDNNRGDRRPNPGYNNNSSSRSNYGNRDVKSYNFRDDSYPKRGNADSKNNSKVFKHRSLQSKDKKHYTTEPVIEGDVRLNKYIAMSGVCSRREADNIILKGQVTVNDVIVKELGVKVTSSDVVKLNGELLKGESLVYIVMNKPRGVVTSLDDPNAEKTVIDILEGKVPQRVFPVGRLDKNSLGVLLLTNDGKLTKELTHPSYDKKKIYHVTLDKDVAESDMEKIAEGVELEDGLIYADELSYVAESLNEVGIEIHSGRNRIVRRIFEHLGYKVSKLDRVYFAGITKKNLRRGTWRYLTEREVISLKNGMYR